MAVFFEPDSSLGLPSILPRVHAKGKISRQNTAERASLSLKARQKGSPRIPAGSAASPRNAGGGGVVSFAEESPSMIRSFAAGAKKSPRKPSQGANKAKASVNPSASAAERAPTVMFFGANGGAGGSVAFRGASVFGGGPPSAGDFQRQFSPSGGGHVQTAGLKDLGLGSQGVRAGGSKGTPMKPPAGRGRLGQGLPMLDSEAADSGAQAKAAASKMTKLALGANQGPSSFSRQTSAADRASKPKPVDKSDNIDLGPLAALPLGRQIHVDEAHVKSLVGEGEPEFIKGFHEVQELILSLFRAADTDGDTQITHSQLKGIFIRGGGELAGEVDSFTSDKEKDGQLIDKDRFLELFICIGVKLQHSPHLMARLVNSAAAFGVVRRASDTVWNPTAAGGRRPSMARMVNHLMGTEGGERPEMAGIV
eukprot:CAMPEP_0115166538 /NCGR_PEP_ID=MMETSP0227-20121206/74178_1 /TAXON_ID=89957 /ORGANISM="Polarella glacialis, Strain CCMP 1383" /LENGTH=422 /DNA_ID=CAMNT_0002579081 /DNA_START=56 /DNA_END=1320 /DNA_ORIENTATION=+